MKLQTLTILIMEGGKTVLKKLSYSSCAILITVMLFGMSTGYAQNSSTDISNHANGNVTQVAQNGNNGNNGVNDDNDTDWGWIGLLGLAGLLGLRKKDNNR